MLLGIRAVGGIEVTLHHAGRVPTGLYVVCVYVRAREPREVCKSDKRTRVEPPSVGECEAV